MKIIDDFDIRDNKELDELFYEYVEKFDDYDLKVYSFKENLTDKQVIKILKEAIKSEKHIDKKYLKNEYN